MKPTIFADFQNADEQGRIRLNTRGAQRDIEQLSPALTAGMSLTFSDGELEVDGEAEFSEEEHVWVARIDWSKIRYLE